MDSFQSISSQHPVPAGFPTRDPSNPTKEQLEAQKRAVDEQRTSILKAFLEPEAYERLRRVALVKPENAEATERYLFNLCQRTNRQTKIDEATVRTILQNVNSASGSSASKGSIKFCRKNYSENDDDF